MSTRRSFSSISTCASSGTSGITSTSAKLVWRRFWESNGLIRTSRWTPRSRLHAAVRPAAVDLERHLLEARLLALGRLEDLASGSGCAPPSAGTCAAASRPSPATPSRPHRRARPRSLPARRTARRAGAGPPSASSRPGAPPARARGRAASRRSHPRRRRRAPPSRPARRRARPRSRQSGDLAPQLFRAAHGHLRGRRVIPEGGVRALARQRLELMLLRGQVKGAPTCRRSGARAAAPRP